MTRPARPKAFLIAVLVVLGLATFATAQRRIGPSDPSTSPSQDSRPIDPETDPSATTKFGERLFVHRTGDELSISLVSDDGVHVLARFELPGNGPFIVAHQLVCADGTGPERSLVVFGATSPASVVGSLRMDLFEGTFNRTQAGLFLFVGSEPPLGGKVWELNRGLGSIVVGSVVLSGPVDPDNPPPAPCDDWDPTL